VGSLQGEFERPGCERRRREELNRQDAKVARVRERERERRGREREENTRFRYY
jgi:hypothetical protein